MLSSPNTKAPYMITLERELIANDSLLVSDVSKYRIKLKSKDPVKNKNIITIRNCVSKELLIPSLDIR